MKKSNLNNYPRFLLYSVIVVLLNIVGTIIFFRLDLTEDKIFSLSLESKNAVSTLSEPLTIKVFFTNKLPAPYNNIERYLHDLLSEYALSGSKYFNYEFYDVSSEGNESVKQNQELAASYGILPVQVRNIEQDEVKFQKAYMGMVLIHGELIESLPPITTTDGLEFSITSAIRKMNNKTSALLNLKEKIDIKLFLSSSLQAVGPYMNLQGIMEVPRKVEEIANKLSAKNYDKLKFTYIDPSQNPENLNEIEKYNVLSLQWNEFIDRRGVKIPADRGFIELIVKHGERFEKVQILKTIRIPILGTQYQLIDVNSLEKGINEIVENIINTNEEIGYIADHDAPSIDKHPDMFGQKSAETLSNFAELLSENYSQRKINLGKENIPDGIPTLIIAGVKQQFSDYELYQIDQFLMKGRSLAIFYDPFNEIMPQQGNMMFGNQGPVYLPINTGLEKLLSSYGINTKKSYVLDQNCYRQEMSRAFGGGEQKIYFAPIIKNESINKGLNFLKNIKGMVMIKASPVEIDDQRVKNSGLKALKLISSSEKAWELSGRVNLNPMFIQPPQDEKGYKQMAMAYVLEGQFSSYFADKEIPIKEEKKEDNKEDVKAEKKPEGIDMSNIQSKGSTIKTAIKPGKIFLIGSSEILKNNVMDKEGRGPNAQFIMNVIDYLNGEENRAIMRSKSQEFNPLKEIKPASKTIIKTANIAGLPVLMFVTGLFIWFKRSSRKRFIKERFQR